MMQGFLGCASSRLGRAPENIYLFSSERSERANELRFPGPFASVRKVMCIEDSYNCLFLK